MKPYKAVPPSETIHRIRQILYEMGLFVTEFHQNQNGLSYYCRVILANDDIHRFAIGTNGKGMSAEYALASAYAELMERIENRMLIFGIKYASRIFRMHNADLGVAYIPELRFRYFPDETFREIDSEELWKYTQHFLPNVAKYGKNNLPEETKYKMYFADFYNVNKGEVEHVPYHLLRMAASSTGLCAGNVPEEAILQGLNEIFERYVLQQIYLQQITPPTIPFEFFEGTEIAQRLKRLKAEKGWSIIIKDCSLGEGYPVIGLLLIDTANNRYAFRLGSDLSPVIALQRCFTEAFQGADASERYLQPILLDDDWDIRTEHNQSVVNGMGRFPHQIFGEDCSWRFKGFELQEKASHKEDLQYLVGWLSNKGHTLYIRDNSFLGFPAYHLFIPGLSEVDGRLYNVIDDIQSDSKAFFEIAPEYRLHRLTKDEKIALIEKYKGKSMHEVQMFPYSVGAYNRIHRLLLLALLSYSINKDMDAYLYMKDFLEERVLTGNRQSPYYYCVRDMFYAMGIGKNDTDIVSMLSAIYTKDVVITVLDDMADRENVFRNFPFPTCFQCDKCKIRSSCLYLIVLEVERKIQQVQGERIIDQRCLCDIF